MRLSIFRVLAVACITAFVAQKADAQQSLVGSSFAPTQPATGATYAWNGFGLTNSFAGGYVGFTTAFNGNLLSDGVLFRADGIGGQYSIHGNPAFSQHIDIYGADVMLGYRKALGNGWLSTYVGGAFETDRNNDPSTVIRGTRGGAKVYMEYFGSLNQNFDVNGYATYSTAFSNFEAAGRLGYKATSKITIGPEVSTYSNETYRDIRTGSFITFQVPFGEVTLSGGYVDPLTQGATGYYVNLHFGYQL